MSATRTRKIQVIHTLLRARDLRRLGRTLERLDDVQIGSQLDNLDREDQKQVLQVLPAERRGDVLAAMRYEAAGSLIAHLAPQEAAVLLDEMETDDAVDILQRLSESGLRQIMARIDKEDADAIEELLGYDENTAGGIMSPHYFRVAPDASVGDALAMIQDEDEPPETAFYVYVVGDDDRLVGVCSLRTLVVSRPAQAIRDVMDREIVQLRADTDQEEVADVVGRYDLVAVPIVDQFGRMVGVVDVDDVVDVIREEATEDILKMAGAGQELAVTRSFFGSLSVRWRWLMAAAIGGTVAALSLSGFDSALAHVPELAFFMPVVAGMGGNVGMQSSTIVVRGLAVGFVEAHRIRGIVAREVSLGAVLGLIYGLLIGSSAYVIGSDVDPLRLGFVVMMGTAASMTIAAFVGTCTPLFLDRAGVDPAIATGPFVTTSVDVMGLLLYFWLASAMLGVSL